MGDAQQSTGDPTPHGRGLIELRVSELKQLFNSMDASPFRERDLDPEAEEFIVGWAREAPRGATLALLVHLERAAPPAGVADEAAALRDAIGEFFAHRARVTRGRLRQLLRIGRTSLLVGLIFLFAAVGLGGFLSSAMQGQRLGELLREGVVICGWVAMWRPLEIFLYGWWPILAEAKLFDRLCAMPVRIEYAEALETASDAAVAPGKPKDAWRHDWPAAPAARGSPPKTPLRAKSDGGGEGHENTALDVGDGGETTADSDRGS